MRGYDIFNAWLDTILQLEKKKYWWWQRSQQQQPVVVKHSKPTLQSASSMPSGEIF